MDTNIIATRGLYGWTDHGITSYGTFRAERRGEPLAPIRVSFRKVLEASQSPVVDVWNRPCLDLTLPENNVRGLFEGCIGCSGGLEGHEWDGDISSLKPSDGCGLTVWLAWCAAHGAEITYS